MFQGVQPLPLPPNSEIFPLSPKKPCAFTIHRYPSPRPSHLHSVLDLINPDISDR